MEKEIIKSNLRGWRKVEGGFMTGEGLHLGNSQVIDLCKYTGVPATLVNIDERHGTNATLEVLKAVSKTQPELMVSDGSVLNVMDPKSRYIHDDEFVELTNSLSRFGVSSGTTKNRGARSVVTYNLEKQDTDSVLGDVFQRRVHLDRLPQGGLIITAGLLRLICTNGCVVADNQYRQHFRTKIDDAKLAEKLAAIAGLQVEDYFKKLFSHNGEWVEASVANFLGMRQTLEAVTCKEVADQYFILDPITKHYEAQGTDISKLPRTMLEKLPSGLSYFDCFNILTHGAKQAEDLATAEEVAIGGWAAPSKLSHMKATVMGLKGRPEFDPILVSRLKGDAA